VEVIECPSFINLHDITRERCDYFTKMKLIRLFGIQQVGVLMLDCLASDDLGLTARGSGLAIESSQETIHKTKLIN
jgi:hypothetical protein